MKNQSQDLNETIKERYALINKKTAFLKNAAKALGKSPHTLRNHWVGGFWDTPEDSQEEFLQLINDEIETQELKETA